MKFRIEAPKKIHSNFLTVNFYRGLKTIVVNETKCHTQALEDPFCIGGWKIKPKKGVKANFLFNDLREL
ncbi:hypothetical protein [Mesoflavibacter sp. SCSIO 43206]|uniref:hypothetical protein n=1 Tax=Mesoflavibacter sp. SCSIO 43206 TaxID=2779362 RepID=UPI001CA95A13|nr:hypothetical protein [Mesoflavibacter sp. SCSIO 43206]UAB75136.1 hypothetical protein INR78_12200 [Mesoflavibacter sp. SCSIO 43206]